MRSCTLFATFATLLGVASVALAGTAPAPATPKVPPGWSLARETLCCPQCAEQAVKERPGKCSQCGAGTASIEFLLCKTHAIEQRKCAQCSTPYPPGPTAGLRLQLNWLRPGTPGDGPTLTSDTADTLPIWVTVVNPGKEPVAAPEYLVRGSNPGDGETLLFILTSGKTEMVRFNLSPWRQLRRALPPLPFTFPAGATSFECDLGRSVTLANKPIPPGAYKVRAVAGWLESNELTLTIKGGSSTSLDPKLLNPTGPEAVEQLTKMCDVYLKEGKYEQAAEVAQRIGALNPEVGRKLLAEIWGTMKDRATAPPPQPVNPQAQAAIKDLTERWDTALRAGKFDEALECAKRVMALDPKSGEKLLATTEAAVKRRP